MYSVPDKLENEILVLHFLQLCVLFVIYFSMVNLGLCVAVHNVCYGVNIFESAILEVFCSFVCFSSWACFECNFVLHSAWSQTWNLHAHHIQEEDLLQLLYHQVSCTLIQCFGIHWASVVNWGILLVLWFFFFSFFLLGCERLEGVSRQIIVQVDCCGSNVTWILHEDFDASAVNYELW